MECVANIENYGTAQWGSSTNLGKGLLVSTLYCIISCRDGVMVMCNGNALQKYPTKKNKRKSVHKYKFYIQK